MKANPMKAEIEERNLTWTSAAPRFPVCFFDRPAISFGNNGVDVEKAEVGWQLNIEVWKKNENVEGQDSRVRDFYG